MIGINPKFLNVSGFLKAGVHAVSDHSPSILTAFGAVGVVSTAVLTGKAAYKSHLNIEEMRIAKTKDLEYDEDDNIVYEELTKLETVQAVWPLYIPAVFSGTAAVSSIILAHRISSRRAAVLAAAYALNEGKLEEYQDKIKEKFGVKKEAEARAELVQDKVNREYSDSTEVLLDPNGNKVIIREEYTGRYFWSTVETVKHAVNEINSRLSGVEGSARLSDFYDLIGLKHVSTSDYFGFTRNERLEIDWSTCTTPDGSQAVMSFEYVNHPVMNPEREANFL